MQGNTGNSTLTDSDQLRIREAVQGLSASKDGRGIGDLVDAHTIDCWVREYLAAHQDGPQKDLAFRFGVGAEGRLAGQSFVEAEPELRSEWSSERARQPWDAVRDAVWAGFDRARDRRM